jgi:hypothetical protein
MVRQFENSKGFRTIMKKAAQLIIPTTQGDPHQGTLGRISSPCPPLIKIQRKTASSLWKLYVMKSTPLCNAGLMTGFLLLNLFLRIWTFKN